MIVSIIVVVRIMAPGLHVSRLRSLAVHSAKKSKMDSRSLSKSDNSLRGLKTERIIKGII